MAKIKLMPIGNGLEIERAISPAERRRILDAADTLPIIGGRSKDRHRFRDKERPVRKGYRPFRNRAIVYTLIETGVYYWCRVDRGKCPYSTGSCQWANAAC